MANPPRTLFLADAHLRPGRPAFDPGQNDRLARFFREIAPGADRVVLLGDTFHLWFERRGRVVGDYAGALAAFADGARAAPLHHVCGNRDFAVSAAPPDAPPASPDGGLTPRWRGFFRDDGRGGVSSLARAGVTPHGSGYDFTQDGLRVRAVHGDAYCRRQYLFRFARWGLTGAAGRTLFQYAPWCGLRWLFGFMQSRPRRFFYPHTDEERALNARRITQEPLVAAVEEGVDLIVCGHLHQPFSRAIETPGGRRGRLEGVPAFQDGWYGELVEGRMRLHRMDDPIPMPAAPNSWITRVVNAFDRLRFRRERRRDAARESRPGRKAG